MGDLKSYNQKRDFSKTKEPYGKIKTSSKRLSFVVQHHYATKEHYDLRLEWKGVYVSFAIPKGPSFNPKDKRLAVKVEDHPLSYGTFEGIIPKNEYGGGTVILWDRGTWKPNQEYINFSKGPIKFSLNGKRLKGDWVLVKLSDKDNWILIKENDEYAGKVDIKKYNTSIKTLKTKEEIEGKGVKIDITSPEKVIYPSDKITKLDIAKYYSKISKRMMPFLEGRLISTIRCPDGLNGEKFFMKHLNTESKGIGKRRLKDKNGEMVDYYYIKDKTGLMDEVQMNSYEFHICTSKVPNINKPDIIVFDLDPDEGLSLKKIRDGVRDLKNILDKLGLKSYLKTSGGKGYHIVVPIDLSSYMEALNISRMVAEVMVEEYPNKYTTNIRKKNRKGKIFIDFLRNNKGQTSVAPYSLRLRDGAPISMPIKWSELDKIRPNEINIKNVDKYLKRKDPWEDFLNYY